MTSPLRVLAAAVLAALRPAVGGAQPALVTVRVGHPVTETATPLSLAMRAGLFERAGIKVELTKMASGAAVSAAIAGGALDVGGTSLLALILGHAHDVPFTIFAAAGNLWLPSSDGGLLGADRLEPHAPKDFAGKTITAAAVNDINALSMEAWMAGRVDGVTLTGSAYAIAKASPKIRVIGNIFSAIASRFVITAWFTSRGWVERNRAVAERFARVLDEAAAYTNAHPDDTLRDVVEFTGIDPALAAKMKRATFTTTLSAADVQPVIDVAARYRAIGKSFPASELITDVTAR